METDIRQTTTTQLASGVPNYQVLAKTLDEAGVQPETYWENPYWTTYLGYLKTIPEYRNAVRSLAIWTCGKGWTADPKTTITLNLISGWGEDSFDSIMQDMIVVKKTNGDAYAEIIKDDIDKKLILNIKKLNPGKVRNAVNPKGILIGYDIMQGDGKWHRVKTTDIFHISNDRIANEIHGTSVLESCKWLIDWKNEIQADLRRIMHRTTVRILYVDQDDVSKLGTLRTQYKEAIKNGEVLILPGKPNDAGFQDLVVPPTQAFLDVLRYIDSFFYEVLGVPRAITGGNETATEANSKVGYMSFEQPYMTEQRLLEQDIYNQLGFRVTFNRPVSIKDPMASSEAANTGQVGFQPNEVNASMTKNE